MDLALSEEEQLIVDSAVAFLDASCPLSKVRSVSESVDGFDRSLWQQMAAMGWCGVHLSEEVGGMGLGMVALALLQEQLGRHLACVPYLNSVCMTSSLLKQLLFTEQIKILLGQLAQGEQVLAVALSHPDVDSPLTAQASASPSGWTLSGRWPGVGSAPLADALLLPAQTAAGEWLLCLVPADSPGLNVQPLQTLDATRRQANVSTESLQLPASACLSRGLAVPQALQRVHSLAAIALAAEQVGVAQACLDLTLAYTAQRMQFGKSIASFQAVKHRCAQMLVAVEQARSAAYGAAAMADTNPPPEVLLLHAAQARIESTQAALFCSREAIQLHGGMGFTWESDLHLFLRRAQLASQDLGPVRWWCEQVAKQLLDSDTAPQETGS